MQRHSFDPISFVFGLAFTGLAAWVLFVEDLDVFDWQWAWPVLLILGGFALIASLITTGRRATVATDEPVSGYTAELLEEASAELPDEPHLS